MARLLDNLLRTTNQPLDERLCTECINALVNWFVVVGREGLWRNEPADLQKILRYCYDRQRKPDLTETYYANMRLCDLEDFTMRLKQAREAMKGDERELNSLDEILAVVRPAFVVDPDPRMVLSGIEPGKDYTFTIRIKTFEEKITGIKDSICKVPDGSEKEASLEVRSLGDGLYEAVFHLRFEPSSTQMRLIEGKVAFQGYWDAAYLELQCNLVPPKPGGQAPQGNGD
jgi:hypothetical protein